MKRIFLLILLGGFAWVAQNLGQSATSQKSFDPNYSRESRAAIGAHHLCSGLWVVGRGYKRSAQQILEQDIAPFKMFSWEPEFKYEVDSVHQTVTVTAPGVPARSARYNGDQGCSIMPRGETEIHFKPTPLPRTLPDAHARGPPERTRRVGTNPSAAHGVFVRAEWEAPRHQRHREGGHAPRRVSFCE